jgi:hypothetical protein
MVVSTLKSQSPDTLMILYSKPGATPGKAEVIEGSKTIALVPEFSDGQQMVERIDELRGACRKSRERLVGRVPPGELRAAQGYADPAALAARCRSRYSTFRTRPRRRLVVWAEADSCEGHGAPLGLTFSPRAPFPAATDPCRRVIPRGHRRQPRDCRAARRAPAPSRARAR